MEVEIRTILAQSYNAASIPKLEEYTLAMCQNTKVGYIFDVVRVLVKLYHLFPAATTNNDDQQHRQKYIGYATFLALQHNDLLALQYLLPPSSSSNNKSITADNTATDATTTTTVTAAAIQCSILLDACQFVDFWKLYNSSFRSNGSSNNATNSDSVMVTMSERAIPILRYRILSILAGTYKEISTSMVVEALNIESSSLLSQVVEECQQNPQSMKVVESVNDTTVVFVGTTDNTPRQRIYQEGVSFTTISKLLLRQ